jgi:hypothetical protein
MKRDDPARLAIVIEAEVLGVEIGDRVPGGVRYLNVYRDATRRVEPFFAVLFGTGFQNRVLGESRGGGEEKKENG